jgi:hypothetical protein
MSSNWNFVIAGYSIATVVLVGYLVWIRQRARQLRRTLGEEDRD